MVSKTAPSCLAEPNSGLLGLQDLTHATSYRKSSGISIHFLLEASEVTKVDDCWEQGKDTCSKLQSIRLHLSLISRSAGPVWSHFPISQEKSKV